MFFNRSKKNEKTLELLTQIEAYLKNDINSIEKNSDDKNTLGDEVYNKIFDLAELIEQKQREDLTVYGEIMLCSEKLSDGITSEVIQKKSSDEKLNYIAKSLNSMVQKLNTSLTKTCKILKDYSNQDYTQTIDETLFRDGQFKELLSGINFLNEEITKNLTSTYRTSLVIKKESETLLTNAENLATSSNSQAASLEEVAAALEEITSSVQLTSSTSVNMSKKGDLLQDSINSGITYANNTVTAMNDINNSTNNVQDAIDIIDQIAFQTNILSLNAAVEAATAGEAGKGFAVVAQEVRNLATRSAQAAKEIKELVSQSSEKANQGKNIADNMIEGYKTLEKHVDETIGLIMNIVNATQEQGTAISLINDTVSQIDTMTQKNAEVAEEVRLIANQMNKVSNKNVELTSHVNFNGKNEIVIRENPYDTSFEGDYRRASDITKGLK